MVEMMDTVMVEMMVEMMALMMPAMFVVLGCVKTSLITIVQNLRTMRLSKKCDMINAQEMFHGKIMKRVNRIQKRISGHDELDFIL